MDNYNNTITSIDRPDYRGKIIECETSGGKKFPFLGISQTRDIVCGLRLRDNRKFNDDVIIKMDEICLCAESIALQYTYIGCIIGIVKELSEDEYNDTLNKVIKTIKVNAKDELHDNMS